MAEHLERISHDKINRYLKNEKLTPRILWDNVKDLIEINNNACLVFDDTVIDKRYAVEIEPIQKAEVRRQKALIEPTFKNVGLILDALCLVALSA